MIDKGIFKSKLCISIINQNNKLYRYQALIRKPQYCKNIHFRPKSTTKYHQQRKSDFESIESVNN